MADLELALKNKKMELAWFQAAQQRWVEQAQAQSMKEIHEKRKNLRLQLAKLQGHNDSAILDKEKSTNTLTEFVNTFKTS